MAVISGRYGSVQRLLPTLIDPVTGKYTWQTVNSAAASTSTGFTAINEDPAQPNFTDDPATSGMAVADQTTVSSVTSWSLENTVQPITYIASNTRGYQGKLEGLHSCTGQIAGIGGCPPIGPGQRFKFLGYVGPTNGKLDSKVGHVYAITAIANSVQVQINYQMSNPITWTVGWQSDWKESGDELLHNSYKTSETGAPIGIAGFWDYTKPPCATMMPSTACNLVIGGRPQTAVTTGDGQEAVTTYHDTYDLCLVDANIQFQTEVANFANSCSASAGGWQTCTVGATNCTLNANIHGDHYGIIRENHLPGSNHNVKLFVEGNKPTGVDCDWLAHWEFEKMFFGSFGGLNVDVTTNNPLQFSCAMEFNAFPGCAPGFIRYRPPLLRTMTTPQGGGEPVETYSAQDKVYFIDLRPESEQD